MNQGLKNSTDPDGIMNRIHQGLCNVAKKNKQFEINSG